MIRTRINRLLAVPAGAVLDRLPSLERLVDARTDAKRLPLALARLRRHDLKIQVVYDIGASRGDWTRMARASLPGARFFLFEANELHADSLEAAGERYFTVVLSSEEKAVDFYLTGGSGDSYYREATERYVGVEPRTLQATTLDHLARLHRLPDPDLIKVDVQGAELDVLRGGTEALSKATVVLLECPLADYNEGAPTIDEYLRFMDRSGFTVVDFLDRIWQRGRMIHVDILFARTGADKAVLP